MAWLRISGIGTLLDYFSCASPLWTADNLPESGKWVAVTLPQYSYSWLWKPHKGSLDYPLPHALCKVDGSGHQRKRDCRGSKSHHGTEGMDCCPAELASAPVIQCDDVQVSQIPHGWLWQDYPLLSVSLTYPPVPDCALRPKRVIFIMNWFPDPICRTGPKLKVCVCCEIHRRARVGRQELCWPGWRLLKLALQPLHGWATANLQKGMNTCNCIWTLNIKCCGMAETENPCPCHSTSSTQIFWLCTFSRQPLIYKMQNIYCTAVKTNLLMFLKELQYLAECHDLKRGFSHSALRTLFKSYVLEKI